MDVSEEVIEIEDGIDHELAGTVERDIAPSVDFNERCPGGRELVRSHQQIVPITTLAKRVDRRMLYSEQHMFFTVIRIEALGSRK